MTSTGLRDRAGELLPCPFCGGEAKCTPDDVGSGGQHVPPYWAGCHTCNCAFPDDTESGAIAKWNHRALLASPAPAGAEGLSDDALSRLIRNSFPPSVVRALTRTIWKDGIDIDVPNSSVRAFAQGIANAASPAPSPGECFECGAKLERTVICPTCAAEFLGDPRKCVGIPMESAPAQAPETQTQHKIVTGLHEAIAHAKAMNRALTAPAGAWRTDFENAKDGRQVLVRFPDWCGGDARVTRWVSHHDPSHDGWEGIYNYEPQYWAPLPADVASPAPSPATPPAEARDLVDALEGLELLFRRDGEDSLDQFERIGAVFLKETGYLRPGKDCRIHSREKREKVWDKWIDDKLVDARVALLPHRAARCAARSKTAEDRE